MYHSDGTPLTSDQIFVQLEKIWNSSLQTNKEPVGILTSNHRNSWAKAYSTLIKGAPRWGWKKEWSPPPPFSLSALQSERLLMAHFTDQEAWMALVSLY